MVMADEDQLIKRAIHGDADALKSLLEDVGPVIRREVASRIPIRWQSFLSVDDVMQQTYADAFRCIGRFVPLGAGAFRAWLTSLAECNLRDALKMLQTQKRGGNRKNVSAVISDDSYRNLFDVLSSSGTSPSQKASRDEAATILRTHVDKLPEAYQKVVRLFDLEEHSVSEVAEALGRSRGAVYMLRARAHDRLREVLGDESKFFTDSP